MSKDINNLIISVGNTLKEFADGNLSNKEAASGYNKLLARYNNISDRQKKISGVNQAEGLCYYNNINNFSLLTGIYEIENDDIYYLAYYGDTNLNFRTMKAILNNRGLIIDNTMLEIPPLDNDQLLHKIFLYPVISGKTKKTVFASVSSSNFFSEDKFLFLAKLIKNIFSVQFDRSMRFNNNYFYALSDEIEDYLRNNIDGEHSVQVTLYVFNMLEKIFSHTGIHTLLEISDGIFNTIKDNYRHNSKCFTLSIRDYIAVEKISKNDNFKINKQKLEFKYKNINIPYHSLKLKLDVKESIQSLWDQIMTFENYLATGDIVK